MPTHEQALNQRINEVVAEVNDLREQLDEIREDYYSDAGDTDEIVENSDNTNILE